MFSNQAKIIQKEKKGYRNDAYYGEKERVLKKIIKYEMLEYGNVDILETLKKNYPDFLFIDDNLLNSINSQHLNEKEVDDLVSNIVLVLNEKFNTKDDLKAIWVCSSKEDVEEYYSDGNEMINEIFFDEDIMIISDLEDEGVLIASKNFRIE